MKRALSWALAVAAVATAMVLSCSDPVIVPYCTGIPAGGCPFGDPEMVDGSTNCVDPTCAALYSSDSSCTWTLVQRCPAYKPTADAGLSDGAADDARDADTVVIYDGALRDAGFDVPPGASGGAGCVDLESPDCPLAEALHCGDTCCGCETLYVCGDGGWTPWGECDDAGMLVPASP